MSRMEQHEKDTEQVFEGSVRSRFTDGIGWYRAVREPFGGNRIDFIEDWVCAANVERMGQNR